MRIVICAIEVPRSLLQDFFKMEKAQQVALYCLVGEDESSGQPKAYIGQTSALEPRLKQHHKDKMFWNKVFIFVSITNSFTTTHAQYLESLAIEKANTADRYQLENGNAGSRPHTPIPLKADCDVLFETIDVLATTLGLPIFKPLTIFDRNDKLPDEGVYYCQRRSADAKGRYSTEGFIVLKDSLVSPNITRSFEQKHYAKLRTQLIQDGIIHDRSFSKDYLFNSPSAASAVCCGASSNGWKDWKDSNGKTLNDNERGE